VEVVVKVTVGNEVQVELGATVMVRVAVKVAEGVGVADSVGVGEQGCSVTISMALNSALSAAAVATMSIKPPLTVTMKL
jgi:hypothetical protein